MKWIANHNALSLGTPQQVFRCFAIFPPPPLEHCCSVTKEWGLQDDSRLWQNPRAIASQINIVCGRGASTNRNISKKQKVCLFQEMAFKRSKDFLQAFRLYKWVYRSICIKSALDLHCCKQWVISWQLSFIIIYVMVNISLTPYLAFLSKLLEFLLLGTWE